jgi:hypothetical protein
MESLTGRMGVFFIFVGVVIIAVFLASDMSGSPSLPLLCAGGLVTLVGFLAWRAGAPQPGESGRCNTVRKLGGLRKKQQKPKK